MAEVVEVELGEAHLGTRLLPRVLPDVRCEGAALLAGEDVAVFAGLGVLVEVGAEVSDE